VFSFFQDKLLTKLDEHEPEIATNQDDEVSWQLDHNFTGTVMPGQGMACYEALI